MNSVTSVILFLLGVSGICAAQDAAPATPTPAADPVAASAPAPETKTELTVPDPDRWQFEIEPYVWVPAISTENEIGNVEADTDTDASDLLDILDGALMLHGEARKGSWGMFGDYIWVRVSDDKNIGATGNVDVELNLSLFELGGYYRFAKKKWNLDALLGMRAAAVSTDVDITTALGNGSRDGNTGWAEPMFGARFGYEFTPKFSTIARGDVSGFGIGSELTWNASLEMRYAFTDLFSLTFGYRHMFLDYEIGDAEVKVTFDGPVIGFLFTF